MLGDGVGVVVGELDLIDRGAQGAQDIEVVARSLPARIALGLDRGWVGPVTPQSLDPQALRGVIRLCGDIADVLDECPDPFDRI
jgi:hypothetical protein